MLGVTSEAAAKMKEYGVQSATVVEGKRRALESEMRRMRGLEGTGGVQ